MIIPANPGYTVWRSVRSTNGGVKFCRLGDVVAWKVDTDAYDDPTPIDPTPIVDTLGPVTVEDAVAIRRPDGGWFTEVSSFDNEAALHNFLNEED